MKILSPGEANPRTIVTAINQIIEGRSNAAGTVTLDPNVASTAVSDAIFSEDAVPLLFPQTANAAAELGAGTMYAAVTDGTLTVTHANNTQTDRTFSYLVIGG